MIPYEIDPSLHVVEPMPLRLDDGFSPLPSAEYDRSAAAVSASAAEILVDVEFSLQAKSAY